MCGQVTAPARAEFREPAYPATLRMPVNDQPPLSSLQNAPTEPGPPTIPPEVAARIRALPRGEWVVALREYQRQQWHEGRPVSTESLLLAFPELGIEDGLELVGGEFCLRRELGRDPNIDEFRRRFPRMGDELEIVLRLIDSPLDPIGATLPAPPSNSAAQEELVVPGYEVLEMLGRGGMGVVYKARDHSLKRFVAIKTISGHPFDQPNTVARFRLEAEVLARISHPNIVPIYQIGFDRERMYLVMEYVDGGTLGKRIAGQPQPPDQAARTVELLARAVSEAHGQGIVHRDLKPHNVLLGANGELKLADFGLAKELSVADGLTPSQAVM